MIFNLREFASSLILGWSISFLNMIAGSLTIKYAFKNPGKGFINIVLLSMSVRMFIIAAFVFAIIYFFKVDKISLAGILFFFYFLFLILEINFLSKNTSKNKFTN